MLIVQIQEICANYGRKKVPQTDWNQEFINPMVNTMSSWWNLYVEMSAASVGELETTILGLLDELIAQVEGILPRSLPKKPFSPRLTIQR